MALALASSRGPGQGCPCRHRRGLSSATSYSERECACVRVLPAWRASQSGDRTTSVPVPGPARELFTPGLSLPCYSLVLSLQPQRKGSPL